MTFFIQAPVDSAIVTHALEFAADDSTQALPQIRMPVIRIPRSAKKNYDDGELASAALMMEKLRRREDMSTVAAAPFQSSSTQSDAAMDVVIDRLLQVLR